MADHDVQSQETPLTSESTQFDPMRLAKFPAPQTVDAGEPSYGQVVSQRDAARRAIRAQLKEVAMYRRIAERAKQQDEPSEAQRTEQTMSDLAAALMVAIRVHASQADKQGEPYLLHVLRVVEAVSDEAKVIAALHDVIEDAGWSEYEIQQAGVSLDVPEIVALQLLTRVGHTYSQYIGFIAESGSALAREVKLADLRDNLGRIPEKPTNEYELTTWNNKWASLKARYEKAIATLTGADDA